MALKIMNEGILCCLVVVGTFNSAQNISKGLNITLSGERCGKEGSERSVKAEEKSRGQTPEGGKLAWLL